MYTVTIYDCEKENPNFYSLAVKQYYAHNDIEEQIENRKLYKINRQKGGFHYGRN